MNADSSISHFKMVFDDPDTSATLIVQVGKWISVAEKDPLLQAEFELPSDWTYARLEIEDAAGKGAWSNPLWYFC